jgi:hypothetical protein
MTDEPYILQFGDIGSFPAIYNTMDTIKEADWISSRTNNDTDHRKYA